MTSIFHGPSTQDTLVLETILPKPLGTTAASHHVTAEVLQSFGEILDVPTLGEPQTHISPTFGMSGVLPMMQGYGMHLYAWDHENQPHPPFLSLDITGPEIFPMDLQHQLRDGLSNLFQVKPEDIMMKSRQQPEMSPWEDLAPHIIHQRLAIDGILKNTIPQPKLAEMLHDLPNVMNMTDLTGPMVFDKSGKTTDLSFWGHWETSGYLGHVHEDQFGMDVYTCKAFDPGDAVRFIRTALNFNDCESQAF